MYQYEHTQPGTAVRVLLGIITLLASLGFLVVLADGSGDATLLMLLLAVIGLAAMLSIFHSLTVRVSQEEIELRFGVGFFKRRFRLKDIRSASVARGHWFEGIGINKIRSGWMFSVGGLSSVQLKMKNGRRYKIGTDEPGEVHRAIGAAMKVVR